MNMETNHPFHDIVIIGASAGGLEAVITLLSNIPSGVPAAFFYIQHHSPQANINFLVQKLGHCSSLLCCIPEDKEIIKKGNLYIAPPDYHLMFDGEQQIRIVKGPHENRHRPSIDTSFRSAAFHYRNRVIGIVLSGMLNDGTAGLLAVKKCGGLTMVQSPKDARYPDMPDNAMAQTEVDFALPAAEIGKMLGQLTYMPAGTIQELPEEIQNEAQIAERVIGAPSRMNQVGEQTFVSCPSCGGRLWELHGAPQGRFRCHVGHVFNIDSLLNSQKEAYEDTLWVALRILEERYHLLEQHARISRARERHLHAEQVTEKAADLLIHIERLRELLRISDYPRTEAS